MENVKGPMMVFFVAMIIMGLPLMVMSADSVSHSGWRIGELIETENSGNAQFPQVALDASGNAIVVWHHNDGTRFNIYSNRYNADIGWGEAELIETDDSGDARYPQIVIDNSGNALAVWQQYDGTRDNIWSNRYTAGVGWGTAELIETEDAGDAHYPQISIDGSDNAVAVWSHFDGTRYNIWSNRYTADVGWGTAEMIETDNSGHAYNPQVGMDESGNGVVVWQQYDGARYNVHSNIYTAGTGWGTVEIIEDEQGTVSGSQVALDGSGNAVAVWSQSDGLRNNIWSNRYTADSGWGEAEMIETDNSGPADNPQIVIDGSGNAMVVWRQPSGYRNSIWSNRYTVGAGWGEAELIETDNSGHALSPQIAIDRSGNAVAVWSQYDGTRYNIRSNRYTMGAGWDEAELIETANSGGAYRPQVAVELSVNTVAVWSQSDGIFDNIRANRFVMPDTTPPTLIVSSPEDGSETDVPVITVHGTTEPGSILSINGIIAEVGSDGSFYCNISLIDGENAIAITSRDEWENKETITRTVTYNDPIPSIQSDILNTFNTLANLGSDIDSIQDQMDSVTDRLDSMENDLNISEHEIASLRENLTGLISKLDAFENELDSIRDNLTDLGSDIFSTDEEIDLISSSLEALVSEIEVINGSLPSMMSDVETVEDRIDSLSSDMDSVDELSSEMDSANEDIKDLRMMNIILLVALAILIILTVAGFMIIMKRTSPKKEDDPLE